MKVHKCRAQFRHEERKAAEYWEKRLKAAGLTMEAGRKIGSESITYGHMVKDLDFDGRVAIVPITGESLEQDEWPVSLC